MESWKIKHFLFSRDDDQCIYLYTKNTSQNGNLVNDNHCFANLCFVDGELPENFIKNNKWQIHFPVSMYEWVVELLMKDPLVYLNRGISKNKFFLSTKNEAITEERVLQH